MGRALVPLVPDFLAEFCVVFCPAAAALGCVPL
jgi:hypothetical protein